MIKVLRFFFSTSWKQILIISMVSIIAAGLNVLSLNYLKEMVSSDDEMLAYLGIVALLIFIAATITIIMERYSTRHFENKLATFREDLSYKILSARYEKIEKKLNRLAPVLMVEVNEVSYFGQLIPTFIVAFVQIIAILTYMIFLSWQLFLIVLTLFILVIGLMSIILPRMKQLKDRRSNSRFYLYTMLELMNKGFKDLVMSSAHRVSYIQNSIRPPGKETAKHNSDIHMLKITIEQAINAFLILGFGAAILLYVNWIQASQQTAVQFMAMLIFILPSFVRVVDFFNQIKNAENALDQINALEIETEDEIPNEGKMDFEQNDDHPLIRLERIEYAYNESEHGFKLGPVDLEIHENEITFINGGNGSGKTTIFNLISGLNPAHSGQLYFRGTNITDANIMAYRDLFSCYFTDSPVFDNLDYISAQDFELGEKYIKELELEGKTSLSATTIAQTNLSFGQRGRLNLLRLLLENRSIYLLDEWAANQDLHFKEKFYTEIIPELKQKGKTVILISHDDRYNHVADKVITIMNGMIERVDQNKNR